MFLGNHFFKRYTPLFIEKIRPIHLFLCELIILWFFLQNKKGCVNHLKLKSGEDRNMKKIKDQINAFLGKDTEFEGKLSFTGAVRIDGRFKGEIFTEGTLILGEAAVVE